MGYPEIIMIAILAACVGEALLNHGDTRPAPRLWMSVVGTSLTLSLLAWGGFFSNFGLAQATYIFLTVLGGGMIYLKEDSEENKNRKFDFYVTTFSIGITLGIFWWGGFFS